ncbi:MAG: DUF429 domain-containing protein [Pseudomonadota bacterium]
MSGSKALAGIDLAWQTERNGSAVAFGALTDNRLRVEKVFGGLVGRGTILHALDNEPELWGIAIDAPLIINNATGQRPCEAALSRDYRNRKAGCHPSNLKLYPDAGSVGLSKQLTERGFQTLGVRDSRWQIECYPHPAIIELFGLPERLAYKKGSVRHRRGGQIRLAELLQDRSRDSRIHIELSDNLDCEFDGAAIAELKGKRLKHNEDKLDAIVCLIVAAFYQLGRHTKTYGDTDSGYIVVPTPR